MPIRLGGGWRDRPLSSALRGDVRLLSLQDWSFLTTAEISAGPHCCRHKCSVSRPGAGNEQGVAGFSRRFKIIIGILKFLAVGRSCGLHWGWPGARGRGCWHRQVPGARGPGREVGRVPGAVGDPHCICFVSCLMLYSGVVAFPHRDVMICGLGRKGDIPWVGALPGAAGDGPRGTAAYSR